MCHPSGLKPSVIMSTNVYRCVFPTCISAAVLFIKVFCVYIINYFVGFRHGRNNAGADPIISQIHSMLPVSLPDNSINNRYVDD